jgi:predicted RNase H-like HicB family nuclease
LKKSPESPGGTFVLVKFWPEDGVWNASAMDIPVAVFGETFEEAQHNFEDALTAHFETLADAGQLKSALVSLRKIAGDREMFDRIQPRVTFQKFPVAEETLELCHQ